MKKIGIVRILLTLIFLIGFCGSASAYYLENWNIDTTGSGNANGSGVLDVSKLINISGVGYAEIYDVDITITPPDLVGTFENWGVWNATSTDTEFVYTNSVELTGIYQFSGDVVLGGDLTFKTGILNIYLDDINTNGGVGDLTETYLTENVGSSVYGANDGLLIGTFKVITGTGAVSNTGEITASMDNINVTYESTFLKTGYWIDENGIDLSTTSPISWVLGFSNTTAVTDDPTVAVTNEIYTDYALNTIPPASQGPEHDPPQAIYMTNNGEFKLAVVPEPTTFLLMGIGLLGISRISRKKRDIN